MVEESGEEWARVDMGNDPELWRWAIERIAMHSVIPFATQGEDGPRVRPVTTVTHDGKVYVLTGARDAKVTQLRRDPRFEFYVLVNESENTGYVRFRGEAVLVEDMDVRRALWEASGFADKYFETPADPAFALVRLDIQRAEVMPPGKKEYRLLSR